MFKFFYHGLLGITALLIYSWISLFFLPPEARDARLSNKINTGLVTLFFCVIAGLVWYFQKNEHQRAANFSLYGFYALLLLVFLWAIRNGRWN